MQKIRPLLIQLALCICLLSTNLHAEVITIKIGVSLPLSGEMGQVGEDIRRGFEMGQQEFSNDDLKFELVYEDNQFDLSKAATTAHKLINQDHVDLLVSIWDTADVISPIAEKHGLPNLAIRWNPHIAERYPHTFTIESTYQSNMAHLIKLLKALGQTRVAMITQESEGWALGADYLRQHLKTAGIQLVADENFLGSAADHRSLLLKVAQKKPTGIIINSNPPHTDLLVKRASESIPGVFITGYFDLIENPQLVENRPYVAQFDAAPWFKERFKKQYGSEFKARAPQAYDIIKLLSLVTIEQRKKLNPDELVVALKKVQNVPGASGNLTVSPGKSIESNCVWKIYRDGKLSIIDETDVIFKK